jgi:hypothetical protein
VSAEVARYASEQFGLVVRVSSFRRTPTVFELLPRELRQEQMLRISEPVMVPDERRLLARVERLMEQRNALIAADVGELRAIEKEITALRRHLHEARDHVVGKVPLESNTPALVSPSSDKAETASHEVSAFDIALSMDLEGPPDWSERIDHYLYGVDDGK